MVGKFRWSWVKELFLFLFFCMKWKFEPFLLLLFWINILTIFFFSAFLFYDPEKVPAMFKDLNADHQRMFDYLKEQGTLKWIAVLPPHIADTPSSPYTVTHDVSPGRVISKRDLGAFLVESLNNAEHYQQVCGLATNVQATSS